VIASRAISRQAPGVFRIEIETGVVLGRMPRASLRAIQEGRRIRLAELRANWQRARNSEKLLRIDRLR
jgi:hypothetical protein